VHDRVDFCDELSHQTLVQDRALQKAEGRIAEMVRDVGLGARRKIVKNDDLMVASQQGVGEMRTDKSSPASDQVLHRNPGLGKNGKLDEKG
jgi:hypothetical protein